VPPAQSQRQVDGVPLALQLARPLIGLGVGEVRREAEERRRLPGLGEGRDHGVDVGGLERAQEAVVVLDPLAAE
jgi:hypothetical protein